MTVESKPNRCRIVSCNNRLSVRKQLGAYFAWLSRCDHGTHRRRTEDSDALCSGYIATATVQPRNFHATAGASVGVARKSHGRAEVAQFHGRSDASQFWCPPSCPRVHLSEVPRVRVSAVDPRTMNRSSNYITRNKLPKSFRQPRHDHSS